MLSAAILLVKSDHFPLEFSAILIDSYLKMCIEVRVTYPRCFHVHLGYELCIEIDSEYSYCSKLEKHPRTDPFCPLCSKVEYRTHRVLTSHQFY